MREVVGQNPLEPKQFEQLTLVQLLPEQPESVVSPRRNRNMGWRERIAATAAALTLAACGPGGTVSTPGPVVNGEGNAPLIEGNTSGTLNLLFPFKDTWYLTGGPHSDGLSNGVKYALDFAPKAILPCPGSGPLATETVTASESGKVIVVGNPNDTADANHSIVEIEDSQGFDVGYMHLDAIKVKVGQKVNVGDPLGNPSCEIPPGGTTTGVHVHEFLEKNKQPLPITDAIFDGLIVNAGPDNYQGTLTGDEVITADVGRWTKQHPGPDGIMNEVSNSGASEIPTATPTITQTPAENPTATPEAVKKSPEDIVKDAFLKKWLSTLSGKPQEKRNPDYPDSYSYFLIEPENMGEWQHNIPILLAGGKSDTPLLIRFQLGEANYGRINKISGELQLTNMSLSVGYGEISDFQKNTGTEFDGSVQINSDLAYRSIFRGGYYNNSFSRKAQVAWLKEPEKSPLPSAFSDKQPDGVESSYTIKNGVLKDDQQFLWPSSQHLIHLPLHSVYWDLEKPCKAGYDEAPCQLIWFQQ